MAYRPERALNRAVPVFPKVIPRISVWRQDRELLSMAGPKAIAPQLQQHLSGQFAVTLAGRGFYLAARLAQVHFPARRPPFYLFTSKTGGNYPWTSTLRNAAQEREGNSKPSSRRAHSSGSVVHQLSQNRTGWGTD